ncbi:MAG: MBL fold metallo-hydrolase, partial [Rhodospirillaceae bacterium]|nr:MBL fold metallo-hydrolase [Rhodospirillaceae bacterium]
IDFAGHSTFLITSPQGIKVATDYNDFHRAKELPDIATMSGWHYNHSTSSIEPSITHALYGWDRGLGPPRHDITMKDLRVYSVPANIGLSGDFFRFPTAVFVIESNGICIAHLGLVGEVLAQDALSRIGKIAVLLVPVDQRVTLSISETVANIKAINPKIVIPMHYNAEMTVEHFLAEVKNVFPVIRPESGTLIASRATLPSKTEVHFLLPPTFGRGL